MLLWRTKHTRSELKASMINMSNHVFFSEGDLVLLYDRDKEPLGLGKFKSMWLGPYIVSRFLREGAYELTIYEGNKLEDPRNGLYLKKYYA